ncbi:hypothetical protein OSTOST_17410 [Ostertagia ostertagi]
MDYIINRLREEGSSKSKLSRVEKSDLRNIAKKYNVTPLREPNDGYKSSQIQFEDNESDGGTQYLEPPEEISITLEETVKGNAFSRSKPSVNVSATRSQERRAVCNHKLRAIKKACAVVDKTATSLARHGTDEAVEQLEEILHCLQLAARFAQPS